MNNSKLQTGHLPVNKKRYPIPLVLVQAWRIGLRAIAMVLYFSQIVSIGVIEGTESLERNGVACHHGGIVWQIFLLTDEGKPAIAQP